MMPSPSFSARKNGSSTFSVEWKWPVLSCVTRTHSSIPTGLDHSAQGWPDSERAYPGCPHLIPTTLQGLNTRNLRNKFRSFAVFGGMPAAIGFVFLCDLCDSARAMKPNEITAPIITGRSYRLKDHAAIAGKEERQKGQIQAQRTLDRRTGELNGSLSGSARFTLLPTIMKNARFWPRIGHIDRVMLVYCPRNN